MLTSKSVSAVRVGGRNSVAATLTAIPAMSKVSRAIRS